MVHSALTSSVISAALAQLPGLVIYLGQAMKFVSPVEYDEDGVPVIRWEVVVFIDRLPTVVNGENIDE
ncbi:hotdog family protein [Natronorubrum halophilum]|uniref:hypothetical protein n=1 Tax=Natronorubrum halophilum TaxID=1702106 RepID=UPI000EF6579A